jgi:hypothetical protein
MFGEDASDLSVGQKLKVEVRLDQSLQFGLLCLFFKLFLGRLRLRLSVLGFVVLEHNLVL